MDSPCVVGVGTRGTASLPPPKQSISSKQGVCQVYVHTPNYATQMTPTETQALLIRYQAACTLLNQYDEDGRWELLVQVIDPSDAYLEASLRAAEGKTSLLARRLAVAV